MPRGVMVSLIGEVHDLASVEMEDTWISLRPLSTLLPTRLTRRVLG